QNLETVAEGAINNADLGHFLSAAFPAGPARAAALFARESHAQHHRDHHQTNGGDGGEEEEMSFQHYERSGGLGSRQALIGLTCGSKPDCTNVMKLRNPSLVDAFSQKRRQTARIGPLDSGTLRPATVWRHPA